MRSGRGFAAFLFTNRLSLGLAVAVTLSLFVAAGCGGGGGGGTGGDGNTAATVTSVVVSPGTATVIAGASQQFAATVNGANNPSQTVTWSVSPAGDGTVDATGKFSASSSITGSTTASVIAASTVPGYTNVTGSAAVTINPAAAQNPTVGLSANPPSITSGNSSVLTITSANATGCSWTSGLSGTAPCSGTVTVNPTATTTYTITANGAAGTTPATASVTVTVAAGAIQLTSVTPGIQWIVGEGGFIGITLTGANFASNQAVVVSPSAPVASATVVNSQTLSVVLAIDEDHEGSGYRSVKVCNADGVTGCSNALSFGLYEQNMCGTYPKTGEMFCLNPEETVAGQNLSNGQPAAGYVDKYTAAGAPDGNFFVGSGRSVLAVDDLTGFVIVDATPYDQNGSEADVPIVVGGYPQPVSANYAKNGFMCITQPLAANNESCASLLGAPGTQNPVVSINVGTNPQSLTMGVTGSTTYTYTVTAGGSTPTLWTTMVTTSGLTAVNSAPLTGVTAGLPAGSGVAAFDSQGVVAVTSYTDKAIAFFNETTLEPTMDSVALPGVPMMLVPDTTDGLAVIGNADQPNSGGTFTLVNPVTGAVTAATGVEVPVLPTGLTVNAAGTASYACSSAATCSSFTIPKAQY